MNEPLLGCPHCGRPIRYNPALAGQVTACPYCGGPFQMPSTPPALPAATGTGMSYSPPMPPSTATPPLPPPMTVPSYGQSNSEAATFDPSPSTDMPVRRSGRPPREPWYYTFIAGYTSMMMWLGILLILLGTAFAFVLQIIPLMKSNLFFGIIAATFSVFVAILGLLGTLLVCGLMLLAVDTARNIRSLKLHQVSEETNKS